MSVNRSKKTASPISSGSPAGSMSRRWFMQVGATAAGLSLPELLRAREASSKGKASPDTSVIFVWLPGGPPHMETYDMKPDAPSDYRGAFNPIRTNVPGLDVCELFPQHARIADKFNIIRSIHHGFADHGGGHKRFLTGRKPATPTGFVNDAPCVASMATHVLDKKRETGGLPKYVVLGSGRVNSVDTFSFGSAYLGNQTHPFRIAADPSQDGFKVQNLELDKQMGDRLSDRMALLQGFDRFRRDVDRSADMSTMDVFNQRAAQMLTSTNVREAFDLTQEAQGVRDRFGKHGWGQRALLARRLVERGVPWVTVVMENPYQSGVQMPTYGCYNWDSHAVNCHLFDDAKMRFPIYDHTITAMIEDLYERGLDEKVMLVVTGEFGRTPRLSNQIGTQTKIMQPGRDHWPGAMSMLVSGGGMRTGQVIGATNTKGEEPTERAMTPNDLWATVFRHLGVDYRESFLDHGGRPMPMLPFGDPIPELL
jgi:hypothetical protein